MTLSEIRRSAIEPALLLLPAKMCSPQAEVMLLAIGLHESRFVDRRQIITVIREGVRLNVPEGPARSFWQAELGGGMVHGVLRHHLTSELAVAVCAARGVQPVNERIYTAIEHDDVLAAALARLLLWTDPGKLPGKGAVDTAWQLYLRTWRPGAHSRGTQAQKDELRAKWGRNYAAAERAVYP
ncbi:hypothetical protein [Pseudomonas sp.]|uniref:hypothetical protein n=1 Tax=Pseudomonas sp. TaxID=306 RepID=UPI00272F2BA4|nr:hypothetical protein [Pseudomonas sp.]MDP2446576.1 hypothetical protein [Pseudomonas sp.]MDZ4334262.1 hypothetical protein [Pseudomonas sp.]